ncbi:MAG: hypothetical protein AAF533_21930 [Acidobacteriota bacterium]
MSRPRLSRPTLRRFTSCLLGLVLGLLLTQPPLALAGDRVEPPAPKGEGGKGSGGEGRGGGGDDPRTRAVSPFLSNQSVEGVAREGEAVDRVQVEAGAFGGPDIDFTVMARHAETALIEVELASWREDGTQGWTPDVPNDGSPWCEVTAWEHDSVELLTMVHFIDDEWQPVGPDAAACGYAMEGPARDGILVWTDGNGAFGVNEDLELQHVTWDGTAWERKVVAMDPDESRPVVGSLVAGELTGSDANVYGINAEGRLFTVERLGGVLTYVVLPPELDLVPGSLVMTRDNGNGFYAVDATGRLHHVEDLAGPTGWVSQTLDTWGRRIIPGSLVQGLGVGDHGNAYGVTEADELFVTYDFGSSFALISGAVDVVPGSLALTDGQGVFGITRAGELIQAKWVGSGWRVEIIPHWGPPLDPYSLEVGVTTGVHANIYGTNVDGELFTTWNDGGVIRYADIAVAGELDQDSLAVTTVGVFGIRLDGRLVRVFWNSGDWYHEIIPSPQYTLVPESLVATGTAVKPVVGVTPIPHLHSGDMFAVHNDSGTYVFEVAP